MSERKFTDEEIIAVVKRCASPVNECEGCPFEGVHRGDRECFNVATDELIEIASRQKKELAALKQSEWISVEERLPEFYTYVLTYDTVSGNVQIDSVLSNGEFVIGYNVTHWMPLPEAPKMKGGAE